MSIFDLVFIAALLIVLASVVLVIRALVLRRYGAARRIAVKLGILVAAYMGTLVAVSLSTPQRVLGMREDLCADDWCLAADSCALSRTVGTGGTSSTARGIYYVVTLRVSSRAGRVAQRAPGTWVYLCDSRGRKYLPSREGQRAFDAANGESRQIGDLLEPLASFCTVRVFDLPSDAQDVGLVLVHGEGPGRFIIGDSGSFLHKRTVIRLQHGSWPHGP